MSRQQAIHIIVTEREWKETWSGPNGPAEVTCINRYYECGKIGKYVRFPDDQPPSPEEIAECKAKNLPICKKCEKKKNKKADKK